MKYSVLLPTRNRVDLLRYAIESVRRQDYDDWEIIISDNDSREDVAGFVSSLAENRVRYLKTGAFVPVTENWNNAARHAQGDYLIMLGDDDALLPGYFRMLADWVQKHAQPDVVYTDAYQYAYPNVLPGHSTGLVQRGQTQFLHGHDDREPFWLDRSLARRLVQTSMSFRVAFGFNMQHYLVSRRMHRALTEAGEFYQSPYPDYYAANALLLRAERILVVPRPMVVIGISPKSFGYYYFNNKEEEGDSFLNNVPEADLRQRLQGIILPGSGMNTSWLYAMELVKRNFDREGRMRVSHRRYRLLQIYALYERHGLTGVRRVLSRLEAVEFVECALLGAIAVLCRHLLPSRIGKIIWSLAKRLVSPYSQAYAERREVPYRNILELLESAEFRGLVAQGAKLPR